MAKTYKVTIEKVVHAENETEARAKASHDLFWEDEIVNIEEVKEDENNKN